jgi:competence protein ComEC
VDCGTTNAVEFVTAPFLHAQAINHLPALLLTHGDLRHMGGARELADLFAARKVYAGPLRFRSAAYGRTLAELGRRPGRLDTIGCDDRVGEWRVLHPNSGDRFRQADDGALVLAGTFWGTRVLLLSDLGRSGQYALLERLSGLRADIVVTGLPASGEPVIPALLERLQPKAIVVADSDYPARERASPALRQRLAQQSAHVIYTRIAGAVTVGLAPTGWEIRAMNGTRVSGSHAPGT